MSVYDDIRGANSQHIITCRGDYVEHMEELERNRVANEAMVRGTPILEAFRARRRAQATQFLSVFQKVLLGKAQQL